LKKTPLANVVVSILTGFSFLLGGILTENPWCAYPFIFSILLHMPREIIKDIMDRPGDERFGVRSIPIVYGDKRAYTLSAFSLILFCALSPVPFFTGILGFGYLLVVAVGVLPVCIYLIFRLLRDPERIDLAHCSRGIKSVMAIGLIAMIIG
jgi:4-hydroxybenzoate polyprenyltransferase